MKKVRIKAIEKLNGEYDRYDITVDNNHNFFANGILVHNCQNLTHMFSDPQYKGMKWEVTEKQDGSSVTMIYSPTIDAENPFMVCTRNIRLKPETANGTIPLAWQMAKKYDVERKLKELYDLNKTEIAIQGELIGPGIQQDRDKFTEHEWHVFKMYDIPTQQYMLPLECTILCDQLALTHVPIVHDAMDVFKELPDCDAMLKFAEGKTTRGNEREGLVFKSHKVRGLSFKAVSNRYLMKTDD